MLGFVRQFVPYRGLPIGVDLGGNSLRLAQVEVVNEEYRLVHADEVPLDAASDETQRAAAIVAGLKTSLRRGGFRGRNVAIGLGAAAVIVKHLRMPRTAGDEFSSQLAEVATNALGAPSSEYMLRGVVAGEIFGEQAPQQEVILFATPQGIVQQLLEDAAAARVNIVGLHVQQRITAEYFARLHRRKTDETAVNLFVDLGATGTRAFITAPAELRFVRTMPLSVRQLHDRIAKAMNMTLQDVATLRKVVVAQQTTNPNNIAPGEPTTTPAQVALIDETGRAAASLADELDMCRRYYESTFPSAPVTRLIFTGGGARDRLLCSAIAQAMSLPAQIADPLVRFNRAALPSLACMDRRDAMPHWSTAFGLSLCGQTVAHA